MIGNVKKAEFPYLADWFAISFRWFGLLGSTIALALAKNLSWFTVLILVVMAIWNVSMSILAMLNHRMQYHRLINIAVDCLISMLLFYITGGITGPLSWISVISLLSAAIYYEWRGGILVSLIFILLEIAITFFSNADIYTIWIPVLVLIVYNLLLGLILGLGSKQLMNGLRKNYQSQVNRRLEIEKRAQIQEHNRLQAFYQLIETLSSTLNYNLVLDSALDLGQKALTGQEIDQEAMPSAVLLFDDDKLIVANARRFSPSDSKRKFLGNEGILAETLDSGEPKTTLSIPTDPELGRVLAFQSCASAICLPLSRGLDSFGVMVFAHQDQNYFNEERVELLEMISRQAVIAIQNARLYQQLQMDNANILETQEETRKKLARDLHDGPIQSVSAIAMRLEVARKLMLKSPKEVEPELKRIEELARRTTQEIRHMLFTMRPLVLESEGLTAALRVIADKTVMTYQQRVRIETDEIIIHKMDLAKQTVVFYLAEEAVNNARKHANAKLIIVRLVKAEQDADVALLEIIDNGVGFNAAEIGEDYSRRGSLGMINLKERTDLINGLIHIDSVPGRGTRVQIYIPLSEMASDRLQRGLVQFQ